MVCLTVASPGDLPRALFYFMTAKFTFWTAIYTIYGRPMDLHVSVTYLDSGIIQNVQGPKRLAAPSAG
jgi:hypothetical protein